MLSKIKRTVLSNCLVLLGNIRMLRVDKDNTEKKAVIIVHAALFNEVGWLNVAGIRRLKAGLNLYYKLLNKRFLAQNIYFISTVRDRPRQGGISQSAMIKQWLVMNCIEAQQILTADKSGNTWEDVRNSFRIIKKRGLPNFVYQVSDANHINPRIKGFAKFWGWIFGIHSEYEMSEKMNKRDSKRERFAIAKGAGLIFLNLWRLPLRFLDVVFYGGEMIQ